MAMLRGPSPAEQECGVTSRVLLSGALSRLHPPKGSPLFGAAIVSFLVLPHYTATSVRCSFPGRLNRMCRRPRY